MDITPYGEFLPYDICIYIVLSFIPFELLNYFCINSIWQCWMNVQAWQGNVVYVWFLFLTSMGDRLRLTRLDIRLYIYFSIQREANINPCDLSTQVFLMCVSFVRRDIHTSKHTESCASGIHIWAQPSRCSLSCDTKVISVTLKSSAPLNISS